MSNTGNKDNKTNKRNTYKAERLEKEIEKQARRQVKKLRKKNPVLYAVLAIVFVLAAAAAVYLITTNGNLGANAGKDAKTVAEAPAETGKSDSTATAKDSGKADGKDTSKDSGKVDEKDTSKDTGKADVTATPEDPVKVGRTYLYYNTGHRGTPVTELSTQAEMYYTGDYTYEKLSALEGKKLKKELKKLMTDTMTNDVSYKSLTKYFPYTDAQDGKAGTVLFYANEISDTNISREHVWPKSNASFHLLDGGCDLHHLRPSDAAVNSTRSNYTMGNVKDEYSDYSVCKYKGKEVGWYSKDDNLFEPLDCVKGDIARIYLYVYTRWDEPNLYRKDTSRGFGREDEENYGYKVIESLDTLLEWMEEDPVDTWEMSRNDLVEDVQGNRNVFIDYPELAERMLAP